MIYFFKYLFRFPTVTIKINLKLKTNDKYFSFMFVDLVLITREKNTTNSITLPDYDILVQNRLFDCNNFWLWLNSYIKYLPKFPPTYNSGLAYDV